MPAITLTRRYLFSTCVNNLALLDYILIAFETFRNKLFYFMALHTTTVM